MASFRKENFFARVMELNLEECIPTLKAKGFTTYATFAFGSDYTPQQADAAVLTKQLLEPVAGENVALIPMLRMLWWESWGVATADMKRAAEGSEGDAPRKLSAVEIETRRKLVTGRLVGMTITPELDVSDTLISMCVAMYDNNRLRYIPWEVCTTRSLEMIGQKKDETFTRDPATGFLKISETAPTTRADLASDLKVDLALRRRGLALEMADAMSWECHEKLREELMSALARRPPPGYGQLSIAQIRKADEEAFTIMSKHTCTGIKKVDGERPMDSSINVIMAHRDFNLALQPLPGRGQTERHDEEHARKPKKHKSGSQGAAQQQSQHSSGGKGQNRSNYKTKDGKGGGKGKDKGAGKLPPTLRVSGASGFDAEGVAICYAYNLGGCTAAPPGGKCPRGRHICILSRCSGAAHAYTAEHR